MVIGIIFEVYGDQQAQMSTAIKPFDEQALCLVRNNSLIRYIKTIPLLNKIPLLKELLVSTAPRASVAAE